jgi:ribonucleoside-diphosphate reductase alpha chain
MDCSTTGVEPDYCLVKFKSLAGGGYFRIVNDSIREALAAVGYSPDVIDQITITVAGRGTFVGCPHVGTLPTAWKHLDQAVALAEWQAKLCFHVRMAFTRHVLGEKLWREALAVGDADGLVRVAASGSLLDLYLTDEQIAEVDAYVCGLGHLEDLLPQEHLAIFDCANRCGRTGKRFISPEDHIRMLGAVQPFLSGSCSKTINCPPGTTVEQVRDMYNLT